MRKCLVVCGWMMLAACGQAGGAENWPGYEGGNLHHNASAVDVDLAKVKANTVLWDARFAHPVDCKTTNPGFFGSRNLVLLDGRIALVAANGAKGFYGRYAYVCILDAADGKVVNCIATTQTTGPRRDQMMYPKSNYMEAYDTGIGITVLHWDGQTGILFGRNGGDNPGNTTYLPLANKAGYAAGVRPGVGAYEQLLKNHPDFADADGNLRRDKEIPQDAKRYLDGDQWDYGTVKPKFNNQPNSTAFFEVDAASGLMAAAIEPAHRQAGGYFLANKHTGLYAEVSRGQFAPGPRKVFAKWGGVMVGNGRVFFMGPCDDTAGDGFSTSLFNPAKPDQGLCVHAYKVAWADRRPNGEYAGPGKAETATLTKAFGYEFHSPHKPEGGEDAESYLEIDAFHRNKAWLIDGAGVWVAWKKTRAGNIELIHCNDDGAKTHDLGVGAAQRGQDIWPHISLARVGGVKYIVYYAGNAMYRKCLGRMWSSRAERPLGPAALAVLNTATGRKWTYTLNADDGSGPHRSLPPNEAEGYFDRSHMVVAGKHACIAWVDVAAGTQGNALLRVLSFDITAEGPPRPQEFTYDLGIPRASNRQTCVFDLIAANGVLYALVTESDTLNSGTHTWTAQRVIAIGAGKGK